MRKLLFHIPSVLQRVFLNASSKPMKIGKILLVEAYLGALQNIETDLVSKEVTTYRIRNTDALIALHQKQGFDLILAHFTHAHKLGSINKNTFASLPLCLVFDISFKNEPLAIIDILLKSGCKYYLVNPLTPQAVMELLTIGKSLEA